jgi:thioredoxin reductase (NADPH)
VQHLEAVVVEENGAQRTIETDYFIPLLVLPKLGPIGDWGLKSKKCHKVNNSLITKPGIFAIGDVNTYPGN